MFLALPNSAAFPFRAARNAAGGAESFYLTFDSARAEKGDECTFARATKRKKLWDGGRGWEEEENERKKREKRQRTGVPVAPARTCTAECSLTAWRRDARRRQ